MKRRTIVFEIEHWRKSKLLPEQYCDFLLNLYMDEAEQAKEREAARSVLGLSRGAVKNSSWRPWLLVFVIMGIISFVGFHFTSFSFGMQTGIAAAAVALLYMVGGLQRSRRPMLSHLMLGLASLLLLVAGVYLLREKGMDGTPLLVYAAFCALVWIAAGLLGRAPIFHLAGWLVLFLIYAQVLRHNIMDIDLIGLELSWMPVSLVLLWLGWLLHHIDKRIAAVLLAAGVISWFGAEAYGMAITDLSGGMLQLLLYGKLAVLCILLFGFRKKWIEWVI